jgi:hypothetical protein
MHETWLINPRCGRADRKVGMQTDLTRERSDFNLNRAQRHFFTIEDPIAAITKVI